MAGLDSSAIVLKDLFCTYFISKSKRVEEGWLKQYLANVGSQQMFTN